MSHWGIPKLKYSIHFTQQSLETTLKIGETRKITKGFKTWQSLGVDFIHGNGWCLHGGPRFLFPGSVNQFGDVEETAKSHQRTPDSWSDILKCRDWFLASQQQQQNFKRHSHHSRFFQHLQRGAKWFLKGVTSPSLRVKLAPL